MRLVLKILALPFILVTGLLYGICKFLLIASGAVLGILSGIALLAAIGIMLSSGWLPGLICIGIAFLISPYGLPMIAAWMTGKLGGFNYALRDFVAS
jgi:hypothetical protein